MHALHLLSVKKPLHCWKILFYAEMEKYAETKLDNFFFLTLITGLSFGGCPNLVLAEVI